MWPQVALVAPFACSNLRRALGALPQQTSVYVPRRLGPVTGAWRRMPSARAASRIAACRGETCPRCRPGCRAEASLPRPACPPPRSPATRPCVCVVPVQRHFAVAAQRLSMCFMFLSLNSAIP
jgi:hypothetical protein